MRYIFGDYVLDTQRYELHGAGGPIKLRRKVFQVFAYLLEHRDRVVPKQEILEQLWPGQFVGDEVVKSCMAGVRKALGERGRTPRFVRTLHGQGYRFVAAVEVQEHRPVEDVPRAVPFSGGEGTTSQAEGPLPALSPPLTALGSPPGSQGAVFSDTILILVPFSLSQRERGRHSDPRSAPPGRHWTGSTNRSPCSVGP